MANPQRVIAYFDGFNYYEALRAKKWKRYYWQDMVKFVELFLKKHQALEDVRYFSAKQKDENKARRQDLFFQANLQNPKFSLTLGEFKKRGKWRNIRCKSCNNKNSYNIKFWEEKKSDVALASYMIRDVAMDKCDVSFLFCADSDLTPAIDVIREINPRHKIIVLFPPGAVTYDLQNKATKSLFLERYEDRFAQSVLNETIKLPDGYELKCPDKWK